MFSRKNHWGLWDSKYKNSKINLNTKSSFWQGLKWSDLAFKLTQKAGFCTASIVVCYTVGTGCTEPYNRTNISYTLGLQHYLKKPWSVRWKIPHACWIHISYTERTEHQLETICWGPTVPVQVWVISACDGAYNLQWFTRLKNKLQWVLVYLKTWDKT